MNSVAVSVISSACTFLVTGLLGFFGRTMVRGLKDYMDQEIKARLVPNGGSSLDDKLNRIEKVMNELKDLHDDPDVREIHASGR